MSNDPRNPAEFGTQQFQKIQFGHKPHEEIKTGDTEKAVHKRIDKPASILKWMAILNLVLIGGGGLFYVSNLASQRHEYVDGWNAIALDEYRSRKRVGAHNPKITKKEEAEIKRETDWNKNYFTIILGFNTVVLFASMCFSTFIAVSAHKMTKLKGYNQGIVASVMSCIPGVSPLLLIGIPFGIWNLVALSSKDVRRAFDR